MCRLLERPAAPEAERAAMEPCIRASVQFAERSCAARVEAQQRDALDSNSVELRTRKQMAVCLRALGPREAAFRASLAVAQPW